MDCSLSGSSVHGIFQARVLEWIAISFSRGSSQPRNRTWVSHIAGRRFTVWATREALAQCLYTHVSLFLESHHRYIRKFLPPFHIQIFIYTLWLPRLIYFTKLYFLLNIFTEKKTLCALNLDRRAVILKILSIFMSFIHHQTEGPEAHSHAILTILPYQI